MNVGVCHNGGGDLEMHPFFKNCLSLSLPENAVIVHVRLALSPESSELHAKICITFRHRFVKATAKPARVMKCKVSHMFISISI